MAFTFSITASPRTWTTLPALLALFPPDWPVETIVPSWSSADSYPLLAPMEGRELVLAMAAHIMEEFGKTAGSSGSSSSGSSTSTSSTSSKSTPELTHQREDNYRHTLVSSTPPARGGQMVISPQECRAVVMAFLMQSLDVDGCLAEAMLNDMWAPAGPEADISVLLLDDLDSLPARDDEVLFALALGYQGIAGRYTHLISVMPGDSVLDTLESVRRAFVAAAPAGLPFKSPAAEPFRPLLGPAAIVAVAGLSGCGKSALCAALAKRAGAGAVLSMDYISELVDSSRPLDDGQRAVQIVRQLDTYLKHHPVTLLALDCLQSESLARHLVRLIGNGGDKDYYKGQHSAHARLVVVYFDTPFQTRMARAGAFDITKDYAPMAAGATNIAEFADCVVRNVGSMEDTCKQVWEVVERVHGK